MMSEELLISKGGYLSRRCFSFINYELQYEIQTKYPSPEWDKARRWILSNQRCKISLSAIKVAKVIKDKLDIDLFPLIFPTATKGFDISGGTAAFVMYDKDGTEYLFHSRANTYHSFKGEYEISQDPRTNDLWIYRNK